MRPIVNIPEEDRSTDIGNTQKSVKIARVLPEILSRTDTQTDILTTILRSMVDIQSATAEIRREKNKLQDENIMSASAAQGDHKM